MKVTENIVITGINSNDKFIKVQEKLFNQEFSWFSGRRVSYAYVNDKLTKGKLYANYDTKFIYASSNLEKYKEITYDEFLLTLPNLAIINDDNSRFREIQEWLFKLGYEWPSSRTEVMLHYGSLTIYENHNNMTAGVYSSTEYSTKAFMKKYMGYQDSFHDKNIMIKSDNSDEMRIIQEWLFDQGYEWTIDGKRVLDLSNIYINHDKKLIYSFDQSSLYSPWSSTSFIEKFINEEKTTTREYMSEKAKEYISERARKKVSNYIINTEVFSIDDDEPDLIISK